MHCTLPGLHLVTLHIHIPLDQLMLLPTENNYTNSFLLSQCLFSSLHQVNIFGFFSKCISFFLNAFVFCLCYDQVKKKI